jgi:dihydroflavonol-4-reductase
MTDSAGLADGWPVLVTGASGFVGGHAARALARAGYQVRALSRRPPVVEPSDPPMEWVQGDLSRDADCAEAVRGVRGVIHAAGWVSLGPDRAGQSWRVNVEATRALLDHSARQGVERFIYTSSLWTVAAGTAERPADESGAWNLSVVGSPYCESKREAERMVLAWNDSSLRTTVLCPGLVVGPRDGRPSATGLLLTISWTPTAVLPRGGIPLVDAQVVAFALRKALETGAGGSRYVVAGPYLSYPELARAVSSVSCWPRRVVIVPDWCESWLRLGAGALARVFGARIGEVSEAVVSGGFLRLHVSGARGSRVRPATSRTRAVDLRRPRRSSPPRQGPLAEEPPRPGPEWLGGQHGTDQVARIVTCGSTSGSGDSESVRNNTSRGVAEKSEAPFAVQNGTARPARNPREALNLVTHACSILTLGRTWAPSRETGVTSPVRLTSSSL